MKLRHLYKILLCTTGFLSGCTGQKNRVVPNPPTPVSANAHDNIIAAVQMEAPPGSPRDAQPTVPMVFQLVCYQLSVPVGTVSRNESFWKRIDETALDPVRYDLLRRNGMRLGVAPVAEFEGIRAMLQDTPGPARVMGTLGRDAKNIELPMRTGIPCQTVSYFGEGNEYVGQSFDKSENIFNISYRRTPRKLGDMRITIAPMVRALKKRLEYTARNDDVEIQYVAPVKFYLNIEADIPMDKFMVLAPSDNAALPTIIGHQFFLEDEPAQQMEQVLIFIAQPFRIDEVKQ